MMWASCKDNSEKSFCFLFFFFCLTLPFSVGMSTILVEGMFFITIFKVIYYNEWYGKDRSISCFLLAGLFLLPLYGLLFTQDMENGWKVVLHRHRFLIIPFIVFVNGENIIRHYRLFTKTFLVALLISAFITLALNSLPHENLTKLVDELNFLREFKPGLEGNFKSGLYTPFHDKLQFGNMIGVGVILAAYEALFKGRSLLFWLVIGSLLILFSFVLGARGSQLGFIGGLSVFVLPYLRKLYYYFKKRWNHIKSIGLLSIIGICLLSILFTLFFTFPPLCKRYSIAYQKIMYYFQHGLRDDHGVSGTSVYRLISWKHHWDLIQEYPFTGVGTGDYRKELTRIYEKNYEDLEPYSHNQLLYYWATYGIVGILFFIFLLGFWGWRMQGAGRLSLLSNAFLLFFFIIMMFDTILLFQVNIYLFSIIFSILIIGIKSNKIKLKASLY